MAEGGYSAGKCDGSAVSLHTELEISTVILLDFLDSVPQVVLLPSQNPFIKP